ncbi:MAG: DUF2341 domain-containing protein [Candidatus Paceibacterota bacterium]
MKSKRLIAFTLIELLVVIAIVGILSGFVLVSLNSATDSAKDVKTKNDLAAISRAILTYHALNNAYPIEETPCSIGDGTCLNELVPNHIQSFPLDFNNSRYQYSSDGTSYTLTGNLTNERVLTYDSETGFSESDAEQGLPGYAKRQPITINSASALTDYQVKLTVAYDTDMQPDFDDLRFTSSDGTTELNYWLESKTDSTTATIWVKIPSLASGDNTIYMYYANASATTASNGDNTFLLFDDFLGTTLDTNKWTVVSGAPTVGGSLMTIRSGYSDLINSKSNFTNSYALRMYGAIKASNGGTLASGFASSGSYTFGAAILCQVSPQNKRFINDSWNATANISFDDNNHIFDIIHNGTSNIKLIIDKTTEYTISSGIVSTEKVVSFGMSSSGYTGSDVIDWMLVRKYINTEPNSSFGAEQNS